MDRSTLSGETTNGLGGWIPPPSFPPSILGGATNALAWVPPPAPALTGNLILRIWDVEHGACAMLHHIKNGVAGRLAMIDSGNRTDWTPSAFIRYGLNRTTLDYLFITNADQDPPHEWCGWVVGCRS